MLTARMLKAASMLCLGAIACLAAVEPPAQASDRMGVNDPNLPLKPSESGRWRSRGGRCSGTAVRASGADKLSVDAGVQGERGGQRGTAMVTLLLGLRHCTRGQRLTRLQ